MPTDDGPVHTVEWRCDKCRRIWWDWKKSPKELGNIKIEHHNSYAALEKSAAAGCSLCAIFRAEIIYKFIPQDQLNSGRCAVEVMKSPNTPLLAFSVGSSTFWKSIDTADAPDENLGGDSSHSRPAKQLAPETLDEDLQLLTQGLIQPWIEQCHTGSGHHKNCAGRKIKQDDNFYLPTRLIDVGDLQSSTVRLVVPKEDFPTKKPDYLALSYCWGQGNEPAKTTRANLKDRQQSIDVTRLPKTIQDAIKLSQLIGIRYLWVDALCIVQSHDADKYFDDWKSEAPKMGSYYSNAHCLISALAASDSSDGLFAERPAQKYPTKKCFITFDNESNKSLYLSVPKPNFYDWLPKETLMTRGWCLQETVLSTRTIHWSTHGLLWQCPSVTDASEFNPKGNKAWTTGPEDRYRIFDLPTEKGLKSVWNQLVGSYTSMNFTFNTDRLIAIQGLGSRLAAMHGSEYFAGIFRSNLADGLLWGVFDSQDKNREKVACFPSWSWASCGSTVYFTKPLSFSYVRCTKPDVFPQTRDVMDFSEPSKRMICLEAPLMSIDFEQQNNHADLAVEIEEGKFEVSINFDAADLTPSPLGRVHILLLGCPSGRDLPYAGIVVRPKGDMYERIGIIVLTCYGNASLDKSLPSWRKEVKLV